MALIKTVRDFTPQHGDNCYFADNATIIGDVVMGDDCSVWFSAVVRGDVNSIRIGNKVNIQDGAVIHATYLTAATSIGNNVSIAHNAVVHGCTIMDNVLVGICAIILDNAVIESNVIIAAGSVVLENSILESGSVYAGIPAKKVKEISPELLTNLVNRITKGYMMYSEWYK